MSITALQLIIIMIFHIVVIVMIIANRSNYIPNAPNVVMNLSLLVLSGYSLYLNFDPDNYV